MKASKATLAKGSVPSPCREQLATGLCFELQLHNHLLSRFTDRESGKGSHLSRVTQLRGEGFEPCSLVLSHSFPAHQPRQQLNTHGKLGGS